MKKYEKPIEVGLKLIYDGEPISWWARGKIVETMKPGKYVVSRISGDHVFLKSGRANAKTEHRLHKNELQNVYQPEFADMTTAVGIMFQMNKKWYVNDSELIQKAKRYNKNK